MAAIIVAFILVSVVEVKDIELPAGMQRAMARQAEAERERRAKVIHAIVSTKLPSGYPKLPTS